MTENLISYNVEMMDEFQPDRPGGGKSLSELRKDGDKVFQVYKQEGYIKDKDVVATYLSYDDAHNMCNSFNKQ
jgi:hypothetical protein